MSDNESYKSSWPLILEKIDRLAESQKESAVAIAAIRQQLDHVSKIVDSLDKIVRSGNGHSLSARHRALEEVVQVVRSGSDAFKAELNSLHERVANLEKDNGRMNMWWHMSYQAALAVGWLITTCVALYAAMK